MLCINIKNKNIVWFSKFSFMCCPLLIMEAIVIEIRKLIFRSETPALYQVLPEKRVERIGGAMMASTHIYEMNPTAPPSTGNAPLPPRRGIGGPAMVEVALDPSELDLVDTDAMAVRYEQQIREQQSQLQKEDLSDMVVEHVSRQKVSLYSLLHSPDHDNL